jgi:hypothetical protein
MASAELYIDPALVARAEATQSGAFLVGSYAGWPNFGDYLQLRSTIAAHEQIGAHDALYVLLDIRGRATHVGSGIDLAANGTDILPVYYHSGGTAPAEDVSDGLVRLPRLPPSALVHIYGGGFINDCCGRPLRHAVGALLERHPFENADGQLRLFMSGLQVSPSIEADAWRPFFARAEYIGARDHETIAVVGRLIGDGGGKLQYSADDALLPLAAGCKQPASRDAASIAAHVNLEGHASANPDRRLEQLVQALAAAARHFGAGATCDLLVADPGDHVREEDAARQLEALYNRLAAAGDAPPLSFRKRNIFAEATRGAFSFGASFLVTCSYHVSLAGLLSRCPTLLLVENDCYRQQATGLSEAFNSHSFATLGSIDDVEGIVDALLNERPNRPSGDGSYSMWIAQTEKALYLSRLSLDMDRAAASKRLELTASAFREVAANLGELRRRRSLEQKLAKEIEEKTAVTITIPARGGLLKYLTRSYWSRRRAAWARSIQKRVKKWA